MAADQCGCCSVFYRSLHHKQNFFSLNMIKYKFTTLTTYHQAWHVSRGNSPEACHPHGNTKKCPGITMLWANCLCFSMPWFVGLEISMSQFFDLESQCFGIWASMASFSFSLNLFCNKLMSTCELLIDANYFVSHQSFK